MYLTLNKLSYLIYLITVEKREINLVRRTLVNVSNTFLSSHVLFTVMIRARAKSLKSIPAIKKQKENN